MCYIFTSYIFIFSFLPSLSFYHPVSFIRPLPCNVYLVAFVLYQHKCFNASLQCSPYHIDILPLLYDQLLHFPSLSCLCSTYNFVCIHIYICTYTLLTYLTHLTTLCKYAGETCSSTLAGHPYHC
jgi:hypothetical protein